LALVSKLEKIQLTRTGAHEPADATYTVFQDEAGNPYLQIDTYGSANREMKGKKSQSIQFDRDSAKALMDILKQTYGL